MEQYGIEDIGDSTDPPGKCYFPAEEKISRDRHKYKISPVSKMTVAEIHDKGEPGNRAGNIVDQIIKKVCVLVKFRGKRNKKSRRACTEMMEDDNAEYSEDSQKVKVGISFFQVTDSSQGKNPCLSVIEF